MSGENGSGTADELSTARRLQDSVDCQKGQQLNFDVNDIKRPCEAVLSESGISGNISGTSLDSGHDSISRQDQCIICREDSRHLSSPDDSAASSQTLSTLTDQAALTSVGSLSDALKDRLAAQWSEQALRDCIEYGAEAAIQKVVELLQDDVSAQDGGPDLVDSFAGTIEESVLDLVHSLDLDLKMEDFDVQVDSGESSVSATYTDNAGKDVKEAVSGMMDISADSGVTSATSPVVSGTDKPSSGATNSEVALDFHHQGPVTSRVAQLEMSSSTPNVNVTSAGTCGTLTTTILPENVDSVKSKGSPGHGALYTSLEEDERDKLARWKEAGQALRHALVRATRTDSHSAKVLSSQPVRQTHGKPVCTCNKTQDDKQTGLSFAEKQLLSKPGPDTCTDGIGSAEIATSSTYKDVAEGSQLLVNGISTICDKARLSPCKSKQSFDPMNQMWEEFESAAEQQQKANKGVMSDSQSCSAGITAHAAECVDHVGSVAINQRAVTMPLKEDPTLSELTDRLKRLTASIPVLIESVDKAANAAVAQDKKSPPKCRRRKKSLKLEEVSSATDSDNETILRGFKWLSSHRKGFPYHKDNEGSDGSPHKGQKNKKEMHSLLTGACLTMHGDSGSESIPSLLSSDEEDWTKSKDSINDMSGEGIFTGRCPERSVTDGSKGQDVSALNEPSYRSTNSETSRLTVAHGRPKDDHSHGVGSKPVLQVSDSVANFADNELAESSGSENTDGGFSDSTADQALPADRQIPRSVEFEREIAPCYCDREKHELCSEDCPECTQDHSHDSGEEEGIVVKSHCWVTVGEDSPNVTSDGVRSFDLTEDSPDDILEFQFLTDSASEEEQSEVVLSQADIDSLPEQLLEGSDSEQGEEEAEDADDEYECECSVCQANRPQDQGIDWSTFDISLRPPEEALSDDAVYFNLEPEGGVTDAYLPLSVSRMEVISPWELMMDVQGNHGMLEIMFQNVITQMLSVYPDLLVDPAPEPVTKEMFDTFPVIDITKEQLEEETCCPICLCAFLAEEKAKQLPCSHIFHVLCIQVWLQKAGTCPVCRFILTSSQTNPSDQPADL